MIVLCCCRGFTSSTASEMSWRREGCVVHVIRHFLSSFCSSLEEMIPVVQNSLNEIMFYNFLTLGDSLPGTKQYGKPGSATSESVIRGGIRPKCHPVPYIVHYFWPEPYGPWLKVVHYVGNRVPLRMQSCFPLQNHFWYFEAFLSET
jgi:hypothetical protein